MSSIGAERGGRGVIQRIAVWLRAKGITAPVLAACMVGVGGSLMFLLVPLLLDALRRSPIGWTEREVGLIGSADLAGMFIGATLSLIVVAKCERRSLAFAGLTILCAANVVSMATDGFTVLWLSRVLAGIGGGLALSAAYAQFGATAQPERSFALFLVLQTVAGSAAILLVSPFLVGSDLTALFATSLSFAVVAMAGALALDRTSARAPSRAGTSAPLAPLFKLGSLTVVAYFLFGAAALAIWANIESIGRSFGLPHSVVAATVSGSLLGTIAGELLVIATGKRWGRIGPTLLLSVIYVIGATMLLRPQDQLGFAIALTAFQCGTNLGSWAFGAISEADPSGRMSVAYLLSLKAGFAVGPLAASWLILDGNFATMTVTALAVSVVVCALIVVQIRFADTLITRPA